MKIARLSASLFILALSGAGNVHAASSEWHHVEGGAIRIVTSGSPDSDGQVRGALEIKLDRGWKTYWRDPGESGVPPMIAILAGGKEAPVTIDYPAPKRFDDGYSVWAGYDKPVSLGLTFTLPDDVEPSQVEADVFLGVCETICVPVQARLTLDPSANAHAGKDVSTVAATFAALPGPAREGFEARLADVSDGEIRVETTLPASVRPLDLFVAGTETLVLGMAELDEASGAFSIAVQDRDGKGGDKQLAYTLITSAGAVSGTLDLP